MNKEHCNPQAEVELLTYLKHNPDTIIDIDSRIIARKHFAFENHACIYDSIKECVLDEKKIDSGSLSNTVIMEKIAELYPAYYQDHHKSLNDVVSNLGDNTISNLSFKKTLKIVINHAITRQAIGVLEKTQKQIVQISNPREIPAFIESEILDFTRNVGLKEDVGILGSSFDKWLLEKQEDVKNGNIKIGIPLGFPNYEHCIGGGYRKGTIHVIAGRSKMGKSFLGINIADNVVANKIPVLYLDTELDDEYQTIRRMARRSQVPLMSLESGIFFNDQKLSNKVAAAKSCLSNEPIYYVDIKGWSIEDQVSVIRRFFSKIVGKNSTGQYNEGLVVLDYLKLMNSKDKGADKEYEALGYRMTALHDLMGEMNNPMLALCQQNRAGLEEEHEGTVAGSDRIIWLCDSFTIFSKIPEPDMKARIAANPQNTQKIENCKLKIVACRHGSGTPNNQFVSVYTDLHDPTIPTTEVCGIIKEGPIQTTIINGP